MAAVPVIISGVVFDKYGRTGDPVTIMGMASIAGLGVGGGPMPPGQGGEPPLGIWGPTDPRPGYGLPEPGRPGAHPEHPIVYPPGIWGPTDPRPGVGPIIPPEGPPPEGPVDGDGFVKPPPQGGGWGYHQTYQWLYDPPPGSAGPK